jgi:hypothetical protein
MSDMFPKMNQPLYELLDIYRRILWENDLANFIKENVSVQSRVYDPPTALSVYLFTQFNYCYLLDMKNKTNFITIYFSNGI